MKHGDQAKAKSAQAAGKVQGKSDQSAGAKAGGKAGQSSKAAKSGSKQSGQKAAAKASPGKVKAAVAKKTEAEPKGGNGKTAANRSSDTGFSNPVVANAFKRAVKKYPNAFRRLTD